VTGTNGVVPPTADTIRLASTQEWRSVCTRHHCMLLEGPEDVTETVLLHLKPHLRTPVVWTCSRLPRDFPAGLCGALVLRDVAALGRKEQERLLGWLDAPHGPTQVVSTTARPLFHSVARGHFDDVLYYRLNVIRLCVDSNAIAAIPRTAIESSTGTSTVTQVRAPTEA
jgi:Sigma-54 interaction domain